MENLFDNLEITEDVGDNMITPEKAQDAARIVNEAIAGYIAKGQKLQAIKLIRNATGMGLKDAKDGFENTINNFPSIIGEMYRDAIDASPAIRLVLTTTRLMLQEKLLGPKIKG